MRRLPIQKAVNLGFEEWIVCYSRENFNAANNVYDGIVQSARELDINVAEPHWIELYKEDGMSSVEEELQYYMTGTGSYRFPKMLVLVLKRENLYDQYK